jgi:hypothetical protein
MRALSGLEAVCGFTDETSQAWDVLYSKSDRLRVEERRLSRELEAVAHAD